MERKEEPLSESKNVKVYVRILPLLTRCENCAKISHDKKAIYVRCLQDMKQDKNLQSENPLYWSFLLDGVFHFNSQEEIYSEITQGVINSVLDGANFVLVSCGQTGTGKSFTTGGLRNNWEHRGVVPRLIAELMVEKKNRKRTNRIHYSLSHVEFRAKKITDLLDPNAEISEITNGYDALKNISRVNVKSENDALQYIFQGEGRRAHLADFTEYPVCHLGTSVITFHIYNRSLIDSWPVVSEAMIHIVEMAGIDNTGKSSCFKPASDVISANSTKLELEQYFEKLGNPEKTSSPFARSSCLLKYLGDTLSYNSIIRFVAQIKVTKDELDVSLSTLRFVGKMAKIRVSKVSYNKKPESAIVVEKLRDMVETLKRELYINEMFFRQEALMNVSSKRARQIEDEFLGFLNGSISDFELISFSQTKVLVGIMKDLYAKLNGEKEEAREDAKRCKNDLENSTRIISKTSVKDSRKGTSHRNSISKDIRLPTETEGTDESDNGEVGALEDQGITLGPGISKIPAVTAATFSNLMGRNEFMGTVPSGEKVSEEYDIMNNDLGKDMSGGNMKKKFERLQKMLERQARGNHASGSMMKKRSTSSNAASKMKQRNNKK